MDEYGFDWFGGNGGYDPSYDPYITGLNEWDGIGGDTGNFIDYGTGLRDWAGGGGGGSFSDWLPNINVNTGGVSGGNFGNLISSLLSGLNSPLGMGLLGAGLGSIDGSRQSGNTTVTSEPWSAQQPYLLDLFQRAQRAANTSTAANPMETQATGQMQTAASGNLTNPLLGLQNPFLTGQINQASQDIMNNLQPQWAQAQRQSGSFGNTGVNEAFAKSAADQVGKVAQNMRFNDYTNQQQLNEADVNRRMGAVNNLYQVGRQQRTNAFEPLKNYSDLIRGSYGSTQTTPNFTNPFAGALGGGLLGTQIYKMMQ